MQHTDILGYKTLYQNLSRLQLASANRVAALTSRQTLRSRYTIR